jgi:hypothetical protein
MITNSVEHNMYLSDMMVAAISLPVSDKNISELTFADLQPYGVFLTGVPRLIPPIDDNQWTVVDKIVYVANDGTVCIIEAGTKTDLASTPNLIKLIFGGPGKETIAAVVHDGGYRNPKVARYNILTKEYRIMPKAFWDKVFDSLMIATKTEKIKQRAFYMAVNYFGWFAWWKSCRSYHVAMA